MPTKPSHNPVVVNNTPLVALAAINHLSLFRDLYTEILIPPAVEQEFLAIDHPVRQAILQKASWIKVTSLRQPQQALSYANLDQGEAEVLTLAVEQNARLVIIDELKGRRYAQRLGLTLTGTLGVLYAAKQERIIPGLKPLVEALLQEGLYFAPNLIEQVLILAGEHRPSRQQS